MGAADFDTCDVLGIRCVVGDLDSACAGIIEHARAGGGGYGVLCNVHVLMTARRVPAVMAALQNAWAVFPDGAPVAWVQRREGASSASRVGGPDLMPIVLDRGRGHGIRHALFGSTPKVLQLLRQRIESNFPGTEIVTACSPDAGKENEPDVLHALNVTNAQIIWCALGAPKQELWMARHAAALAPSVLIGVGAAFDFHAGTKTRAPAVMQRLGAEWLYRLATEPRRLARRYAVTNAAFALSMLGRFTRTR
jgi:N-acetylglucosaminyldiphosphoundecaprenol N-acetyl-beta-D-mannosaminyltransferase